MGLLISGLTLAKGGIPSWVSVLLTGCDDEYQRLLSVRQVLLASAFTLFIATVLQYLAVSGVLAEGPQRIGAIWFAMFGLGAPIMRRRA